MQVNTCDCEYICGLVESMSGRGVPFGTSELHTAHPYGIASLYARTLDGEPIFGSDGRVATVSVPSLAMGLGGAGAYFEVSDDCSEHTVNGATYLHRMFSGTLTMKHTDKPFYVFRVPAESLKATEILDDIYLHLRIKGGRVSFYADGMEVNLCESYVPKDYDLCINGPLYRACVLRYAVGEVEVSVTQDGTETMFTWVRENIKYTVYLSVCINPIR